MQCRDMAMNNACVCANSQYMCFIHAHGHLQMASWLCRCVSVSHVRLCLHRMVELYTLCYVCTFADFGFDGADNKPIAVIEVVPTILFFFLLFFALNCCFKKCLFDWKSEKKRFIKNYGRTVNAPRMVSSGRKESWRGDDRVSITVL